LRHRGWRAVAARLNDAPPLATVALGAEADVLVERDRRHALPS
jgi:hypothetical protein